MCHECCTISARSVRKRGPSIKSNARAPLASSCDQIVRRKYHVVGYLANWPRGVVKVLVEQQKMAKKMFSNILVVTLLVLSTDVEARPSSTGGEANVDPSEYHGNLSVETVLKVQQCEKDTNTMELCMRCAKVTKSEFVYPMCCGNEDGIKDWCREYVYFGNE